MYVRLIILKSVSRTAGDVYVEQEAKTREAEWDGGRLVCSLRLVQAHPPKGVAWPCLPRKTVYTFAAYRGTGALADTTFLGLNRVVPSSLAVVQKLILRLLLWSNSTHGSVTVPGDVVVGSHFHVRSGYAVASLQVEIPPSSSVALACLDNEKPGPRGLT